MATGDAALAAGMDLVSGSAAANTLDTEENKTRDYIAQRTSAVTPIAKGGTGSTTAAAARTALGITAANIGAVVNDGAGTLRIGAIGGNRVRVENTGYVTNNTLAYLGDISGLVSKSGDTMSGDLFIPGAAGAVSSYAVAYINGDGRISRNVSSLKYKDLLDDPDVSTLGNLWPVLRAFTMKGDPAEVPTLGYIAEQLDADDDLSRFVVRIGGSIEAIDYIQLLIAQVAQLNARLEALEAEHADH